MKTENKHPYPLHARAVVGVKALFNLRRPFVEIAMEGLDRTNPTFGMFPAEQPTRKLVSELHSLQDKYEKRIFRRISVKQAYDLIQNGYGSAHLQSILARIIWSRGTFGQELELLRSPNIRAHAAAIFAEHISSTEENVKRIGLKGGCATVAEAIEAFALIKQKKLDWYSPEMEQNTLNSLIYKVMHEGTSEEAKRMVAVLETHEYSGPILQTLRAKASSL